MKQRASRFHLYLIRLVLSAGILAVLIFTPLGGMINNAWKTRTEQKHLLNTINATAVAADCGRMIKKLGTNDSQIFSTDDPSVPTSIAILRPSRINVFTNQAHIIFGGSFNRWKLLYYERGPEFPNGPWLEFTEESGRTKKLWP